MYVHFLNRIERSSYTSSSSSSPPRRFIAVAKQIEWKCQKDENDARKFMKFTNDSLREDLKWENAIKEVDLWALDEAWEVITNAILSKGGNSDEEMADKFFKDFLDSDHSSHCDEDELFEGLRSCGVQISTRQMHVLFVNIDQGGNKLIEAEEFRKAFEEQKARVDALKAIETSKKMSFGQGSRI